MACKPTVHPARPHGFADDLGQRMHAAWLHAWPRGRALAVAQAGPRQGWRP